VGRQICFRAAFQVSGKHRRRDVRACFHRFRTLGPLDAFLQLNEVLTLALSLSLMAAIAVVAFVACVVLQ
jgi:hypothetical protein